MTKKRKKRHKPKPQTQIQMASKVAVPEARAIAEEVSSGILKRQIHSLKQLQRAYKSFRDMEPGGRDWNIYAEIMGPSKEKEMSTWLWGPVLIVGPLSEGEERFFDGKKVEYIECLKETISFTQWGELFEAAQSARCSFVYLPMFKKSIIQSINNLLSLGDSPVRVRGQLLDEKGYPLGRVY